MPPLATTVTYCMPSTLYVKGGALPAASRIYDHNSRPSDASYARMCRSGVPVANIRPDFVANRPPKLSCPVVGIPRAVSSLYSPNGFLHTILPSFKSTATISPQGGLEPG